MLTLTTLHEQLTKTDLDRAWRWLEARYQDYLTDDGPIDAPALAAALARDRGLVLATAEDLAAEFKRQMDGVKCE